MSLLRKTRMKKQMSRGPVQSTMVAMSLLLAACTAPDLPSVSSTGGYSVEVSEGSDRRALAMERAVQVCAQETRNPNVIYVLEDVSTVKVHFSCEGMRGAAELAPPRYRTLGEGYQRLERKLI